MAQVFTPLSNDGYALPRAQVLFRKQGSEKFINLGDCETFTITPNLTEIERYSKEYSTRTLTRSDVVQKDGTISLTVLHMTDTLRAALFMADTESYLVQAAVSAGTATFTGVEAGDIYSLGARDVTVTSVEDGETTPVAYVLNTHYKVDRRTGFLEIIAVPSGAGDDLVVEYTAPAITTAAKRQDLGFMSNNGVRGEIFSRGVNDIGQPVEIHLWSVELRPDGDIEVQGGDDYQQASLTGRLYADGTRPAGYSLGQVTVIPTTDLA